jgi:uncharacterized membrane protein (UPF0127 family)
MKGHSFYIVKKINASFMLAHKAKLADSFMSRLFGLIGKRTFNSGEGLLLTPCNSIHSFFMDFKIDVLFLDKSQQVIFLLEGMPPNRISPVIKNSLWVIELPEGIIASTGIRIGDQIGITPAR